MFVIIDYHYQYQSIIDGNRSINIIDCCQYAISINYLFSKTFQLSISSSTKYKVSHFDIIALRNYTRKIEVDVGVCSTDIKRKKEEEEITNKLNRVWTYIVVNLRKNSNHKVEIGKSWLFLRGIRLIQVLTNIASASLVSLIENRTSLACSSYLLY